MNKSGFTLLEVIVALTIFGISICIFVALIGGGLKATSKADRKIAALDFAKEKIDIAVLGLLGEPTHESEIETIWAGETDLGLQWVITQRPWQWRHAPEDIEEIKTDWLVIEVKVDGLELSTVCPRREKDAKG